VDKARVNVNIGLTYLHAGNSSEALKYLTYAQATYKRLLPEKHLFAIELLGHLGTVHETTGNFILAMELFYQQLRQSEEILLADHSQLITSLGAIMRVQTKMNQTSNISELLSEYQQKLSKTLDYHHPSLVHIITMTASLLESSEPVEAIRLYDQVFEVSQKSKQSNYSLTLKLHRKLAELNRKIGNPMEALDHALQALKIQQQFSLEQGNRSLEADDLHTIGSIYLEMKLFTDALQYLIKSLAIYQTVYASDHPSIQAVLIDIVQAANQSRSNQ
jgi:tetratricopeptide (TPR) repeat protein